MICDDGYVGGADRVFLGPPLLSGYFTSVAWKLLKVYVPLLVADAAR